MLRVLGSSSPPPPLASVATAHKQTRTTLSPLVSCEGLREEVTRWRNKSKSERQEWGIGGKFVPFCFKKEIK